jgi:hypothetical protein
MSKLNWLLAAAFLFTISSTAHAQIDQPTFKPHLPTYKAFDPNQLYAVSITCAPLGGDIAPISEKTSLFTTEKYTTTYAVFISTKTAVQIADGTAKLPDGALGMALVYVTDGDKGTEIDNREACDQTFLVKQTDTLFVIPALNYSKTVQPGPFFAAIDPIIKIITPLTSIFFGTAIPAAILNKVSAVEQTGDPFGKLLSLFNKNHNFARTYKLSTAGPTVLDTQFGRVTVTVKSVPAIVDVPKYLDELKQQIDGAPQKIPTTGIHDTCVSMAAALGRMGFVSPKDQAYALTYVALKSFTDKNDILECLGKKRAQLAVSLGDLLWRGVPDEIRITQADVDNMPEEKIEIANQPSFDSIRPFMDQLMVRMGQYAKNSPPLPDAVKILPTLIAKDVVISNLTQSTVLLQGGVANGFPAFLDGLMAKGFYHFGCFAQNTDATGKFANDTNVLFLAFKAKPEENKTAIGNTMAMFPVFTGGLVSALVASDNIDWIRSVLAHRDQAFDCDGFQVEDK